MALAGRGSLHLLRMQPFTWGGKTPNDASANYVLVLSTPFIILSKPQATSPTNKSPGRDSRASRSERDEQRGEEKAPEEPACGQEASRVGCQAPHLIMGWRDLHNEDPFLMPQSH